MNDRQLRCSRRKFLAQAAGLTLAGGASSATGSTDSVRAPQGIPSVVGRRPVAVVASVWRPLSNAYHLVGRFLHGYSWNGQKHLPGSYIASAALDQVPDNDLSRSLAREFGFLHSRSVAEALTLGTGKLAVDGVLILAEHGNYPRNDLGQILAPRFDLMEQVVEVFRTSGRSVPVFVDKQLSHSYNKARTMVRWARELNFPLLAGSSLPVTWRIPEVEVPLHSSVEEGLVAGYGPIEVFGFHGLEALQTMMERRMGQETGVQAVTCLTGKEVWKAGDAGIWSWDLLDAALARSETLNLGDVRQNVGAFSVDKMPPTPATAFLIEFRDGRRGTVLLLNGHVQDFTCAVRLTNAREPLACRFAMPPAPGARHFDCQAQQIEKLFTTRATPYPVERTLLTTGILARAMESHHLRGMRLETPELDIVYHAPSESGFARSEVARA